MDLAKRPENRSSGKIIRLLLNLPGFWLVYYFVSQAIQSGKIPFYHNSLTLFKELGFLSEFKNLRNIFYLGYVVLFILIGLYILVNKAEFKDKNSTPSKIIAGLISGLIFVTFSYAIAGLFIDFYYFIVKILNYY